jgi:hypothetical protein
VWKGVRLTRRGLLEDVCVLERVFSRELRVLLIEARLVLSGETEALFDEEDMVEGVVVRSRVIILGFDFGFLRS